MARHNKLQVPYPAWVDALSKNDACLRSTAEDVYYAKALAEREGAQHHEACAQLLRGAEKSLARLENTKISVGTRCKEGDRAARKFWEAKVCARKD